MSLILLLIVLVLLFIEYVVMREKSWRTYNKVPGLWRFPVIGNVFEVFRSEVELFYKARLVANNFRNKDNICRTSLGYTKILNVYDPDDLEVILSSPKYITKGKSYYFLRSWLNDGLLTSSGDKWFTRRKILTPTFHFNILRQFTKVFVEQSDIVVNKLKNHVGKETEVLPLVTDFALQSILETALGTNMDSKNQSLARYKKAIYDMGLVLVRRFTRFWLYVPFIYALTPTGKKEKGLLTFLHGFTKEVIKERRAAGINEAKMEVDDLDENAALGLKKRLAMMDLLLKAEAEGKINEEGIREEVDTFTFEGHDTTTMAITFALMLIANHPEVQDRILEEINEVLGDTGKNPTVEDFNKMSYLEMCIKEALRLFPSVPFISRFITEELKLKKYTIPAGTDIFIHIFDIHRNPDLYPDPDKFKPERFSPENSRGRHPYAYIPFSAGPRNCIGQRFAMYEEKAVISAILKNYKLEPVTRPNDIIFACDVVLRCKTAVKVKFVARS